MLQYEWSRGQRTGRSISCLLIDVDHFKAFNDGHGHLAGDACLRTLAQLLARAVRKNMDLAARYGGEEFAVLMPETELADALKAAERLRRKNAETGQQHQGTDLGKVSVSIGVAAMKPSPTGAPEDLLAAADAALCAAKAAGRNQVQASDEIISLVA